MWTSSDYKEIFNKCKLTTNPRALQILAAVCEKAVANKALYETVEEATFIPWYVVAAIHFRESDQSFTKHLHNGDPLTERTVHVPAGRPIEGRPPFTWSQSAIDAMSNRRRPEDWDIAGCLLFMERYNGLGYQNHNHISPYIWDMTDQYVSGLFIKDGTYDPAKKEAERPGCAAILLYLSSKGAVSLW